MYLVRITISFVRFVGIVSDAIGRRPSRVSLTTQARRRRRLAFSGGVSFRVDVEPVQLIVSLDDGHHHRPAGYDD